ncbi:helix-turn-helix transcriptional regulator [Vibrio alfacsensis]|uniref:helix-turn-helix transcriptional regulator n=1 Tax=Vibrio alfacsensis TaxID=1074311 RepID=UPI004067F7C7
MMNQTNQPIQFDRVLSLDEVASILGRSKKSLWRWWAVDKVMPEPLKVNGRAIGFRESTIKAFLEQLSGGAK